MNYGNDKNDDVKPMKFDWIMGISENIDVKTMKFDWIIWMMKFGVKPIKFDWIVWMMKMLLLLNTWNLIELCEWWKCC